MDKQEDRAGDGMRLEQILYLVEIERYKSMNAAAKELHVTQQNLSSAIKRLEEELHLTLVTRTSKGVVLTKDGEQVASLGRELLDKADKIVHYAQQRALQKDDGDRLDGSIRINISPYFARTHFPALVSQFCEQYPGLAVEMYEGASLDILQKICDGEENLGLINISENYLHTECITKKRIEKHVLSSDRLIVLANRKSAIGSQKSIAVKRLLQYKLLFYKNDMVKEDWLLEFFLQFGQPKAILKSNSMEIGIANLQDNVALVPLAEQAAGAFVRDNDDIVGIPIRPRVDIYNLLLIRQGYCLENSERKFIDMIIQAKF